MTTIKNNDAEFCGKVPLHQTNLIQPHGFLLVIDRQTLEIVQGSENVMALLGVSVKEALKTPLTRYVPEEQAIELQQRFDGTVTSRIPFVFTFPQGKFLATIKPQDRCFIMEVERENRENLKEDSFIQVYQNLKYVMASIEEAQTAEETCMLAIRELKRVSGFDKIMIYQFDENWNGDVIAEIKEPEMDSYLGLKFPASDVPKQARDLYKRTPYRLIPTTEYEAVRLYPVINPATNVFTDLSDSNLRSVAAVHLEYLRNMKVMASMSTRILKDGQLWGLIACHHRTPKFLSFEMCSVFELLSDMISTKVAAMGNQDLFRYKTEMQQLHSQLVENIYKHADLISGLYDNKENLLQLLNADGITVVMDRVVNSFGNTPDDKDIEDLILWLQSGNIHRLYHQPQLSAVFEPAGTYSEIASGILALPIQMEKGNYIIAFRGEAVQRVNWGGNPNEAITFESDGKKYHPRNSFQQWQQIVEKTSLPWKASELDVAEQFRNFIVEFTLNRFYN